MPRDERVELIRSIEEERGSRVIALVTGDRPIAPTVIADDCLRPLYDLLLDIRDKTPKTKRIDLVLYTRGGAVETPWKIVNKIREFCKEFTVIIPYRAHSAGTMVALGADKILMSPMSELGPIDPALQVRASGKQFVLPDLGVEDVAAYLDFLKERARITDQAALGETVKSLADHLTPPLLGRVERTYSHIRLVARKLMSMQKPPLSEGTIESIAEALTEKMYAHGHGISIEEAKGIGLRVEKMNDLIDSAVWRFLLDCEDEMKLLTTGDPASYFTDDAENVYKEERAVGVILESTDMCHLFLGTVHIERARQIPNQINLNLNLPLNLPPNITPQSLPQAVQQTLQQLLQQGAAQLQQVIQQMVQEELAKQAPVKGISHKWEGARWERAS